MQNTTPDPILVEPEHEVKIQSRKQQLIEIFEDQKTKILCDRGKEEHTKEYQFIHKPTNGDENAQTTS